MTKKEEREQLIHEICERFNHQDNIAGVLTSRLHQSLDVRSVQKIDPENEQTIKAKRLHQSIRATGARLYLNLFLMESRAWHRFINKPNSEETYTNFAEYAHVEFEIPPSTYFDNKRKFFAAYFYQRLGLKEKIAKKVPAYTYRLVSGYEEFLLLEQATERKHELTHIYERIKAERDRQNEAQNDKEAFEEATANIKLLEDEAKLLEDDLEEKCYADATAKLKESILDKWNSGDLELKHNAVKKYLLRKTFYKYPPPPPAPLPPPEEPETALDRILYDENSRGDVNRYKIVAKQIISHSELINQFDEDEQGLELQISLIWVAIFALDKASKLPVSYAEIQVGLSLAAPSGFQHSQDVRYREIAA